MPPRRKQPQARRAKSKPKFDKDHKPIMPVYTRGVFRDADDFYAYDTEYGVLYSQWKDDLAEWEALYGEESEEEDEAVESGSEAGDDEDVGPAPQCDHHNCFAPESLEDADILQVLYVISLLISSGMHNNSLLFTSRSELVLSSMRAFGDGGPRDVPETTRSIPGTSRTTVPVVATARTPVGVHSSEAKAGGLDVGRVLVPTLTMVAADMPEEELNEPRRNGYGLRRRALLRPTEKARKVYRL
ncbi:hypothetical protein NMY22_g1792 [Coprinellus aureogranulatus]|nr:hypothetical protein NMY22_g1792 [Coprinellus aureogranulatus]